MNQPPDKTIIYEWTILDQVYYNSTRNLFAIRLIGHPWWPLPTWVTAIALASLAGSDQLLEPYVTIRI